MTRSFLTTILALTAQMWICIDYGEAHDAWGVLVDRFGQVYFSDVTRNCIWRIDANSKLSPFVTRKHSHDISMDEEGNIYGEHVQYNPSGNEWLVSFWKATPSGSLTDIVPLSSKPPKGFSVWCDCDGNRYSWNGNNHMRRGPSQILRRTHEGSVFILAGSEWGHVDGKGSAAKFSSIGSMTFGPDRSIYVTDGSAVRKITIDGTVTTLVRDLLKPSENPGWSGLSNRLMGLVVDSDMNVYVADSARRRLLKVTPSGEVVTVAHPWWPWAPTGVTVAGDGIYVLEHRLLPWIGPRVRKISSDGKITTLATVVGWSFMPSVFRLLLVLEIALAITAAMLVPIGLVVFARHLRKHSLRT